MALCASSDALPGLRGADGMRPRAPAGAGRSYVECARIMIATVHKSAWLLCAGAVLLLSGCGLFDGLVGTEIEVKGRHRSLEEQVLGSYDYVGEEVYLLAGVRSIDPLSGRPAPARPMTPSETRALAARRRIEFNRDDVLAFKRAGCVGEGNDGLLVLLEDGAAHLRAEDPRRFRLVRDVTSEENEDRLVLRQRIVDTNPELAGPQGLATVGRILAARYRDEAEPGMRVQLPDGTWTTGGDGR